MIAPSRSESAYFRVSRRRLKTLARVIVLTTSAVSMARPGGGADGTPLRETLTRLVERGETARALRQAQQALREDPDNEAVRNEYIDLHHSLARTWLAERRFEDVLTAVEAILAIDPQHEAARRMQREIERARERSSEHLEETDLLLKLELFDAAIERLDALAALRPELADQLKRRRLAALAGAADDHYLARNFNEAFALYEKVLSERPDASSAVHSRWAISLALALSEGGFSEEADPNAAGRLLARAIDVLERTREPIIGQIVGGMLAERAGKYLDAGRTYAEALGERWALSPVDRRQAILARWRERAIAQARAIYEQTPTERRNGFWSIALPETWKHRQTEHFDVYARNDQVAQRVAAGAEFHYDGIRNWLGAAGSSDWSARCELRVHATQEALHTATGTGGITYAVSNVRTQGERVLQRRLDVFQGDPWLLSSTLPHELTHLVRGAAREKLPPLAVEEGIALQAEPPARKLMYRRLLDRQPPDPQALLAVAKLPKNVEGFYAEAGALTSWLLMRAAGEGPTGAAPIARVLELFAGGVPADWWATLGFKRERTMRGSWSEWYAARRAPHRMALMILVEPSAGLRKTERGVDEGVESRGHVDHP